MNPLEKLSIEKSVPGRRGVRLAAPARPAAASLAPGGLRKAPRRRPAARRVGEVRH